MTLGIVILAAGNALRFGENKLLTPFRGKALVQWALEAVPPGLGPVTVVTQYPAVEALAAEYGFSVTRNLAPELGISRSVALGTAALEGRCDGLLFMTADQPLLRRATTEALAARFLEEPDRIIVPVAEGRPGNPCVFPKTCFPELRALTGDRGGRQIIRRRPELVRTLEVPARELADVDTAAELLNLESGTDSL